MNPYDEEQRVASMVTEEAAHVNVLPSISIDDALAQLTKRAEAPAKKRKAAK